MQIIQKHDGNITLTEEKKGFKIELKKHIVN